MEICRCFIIILLLSAFVFIGGATADDEKVDPSVIDKSVAFGDPQLDVLWIDEKNGEYIPLDTVFSDAGGKSVTLGQLIDKPTLILPIYFYCPSSCSVNLMNLATALLRSKLKPGTDFEIIAFSFSEEENEEDARIAKNNYLRILPDDFPEEKWQFLTGSRASIEAVTKAMGYTYRPLGDGTFIHPSAMIAVAADGMIIKYVYGSFVSGDVDLAIMEAQRGTPAISIKRFLNYCFNYDPQKSRSLFNYFKFSVLAGFVLLGLLFVLYVKKSGKKNSGSREYHETGNSV